MQIGDFQLLRAVRGGRLVPAFLLAAALALAVPALRAGEPDAPLVNGPLPEAPKQQTQQIRDAIRRGLTYLAGRQTAEGSWQGQWNYGVSGLALAAFLGENLREFDESVKRAVGFFRKSYVPPGRHRDKPQAEDACAGSLIGDGYHREFIYEQAIALLATAEYARANPQDEEASRMMIEGARLLIRCQATAAKPQTLSGPVDPGRDYFGSWRYIPAATNGDLSASGWCIVALKATDEALKVFEKKGIQSAFTVPANAYDDFMVFCRKCFDEQANAFMYTPGGRTLAYGLRMSNTTNSVGVLTTRLCDPSSPLLPRAIATLRKEPLYWGEATPPYHPFYFWYYATRAMYLEDPATWRDWEARIRPMLLEHQNADGSWNATQREATLCPGREYSTAVAILILQLCSGRAPGYLEVVKQPSPQYPVYTDTRFDAAEAKQRQSQTAQAIKLPPEDALDFGAAGKATLLLLPAGDFLMGSPLDNAALKQRWPSTKADADRDDLPRHPVRLTKPFYLGQTEVTRAQFAAFVAETSHKTDAERFGKAYGLKEGKWDLYDGLTWRTPGFPQTDSHPVVCVSWNDAKAFCDWLSKKAGKPFSLPTEAQWEYACRAGSDGIWPWGDREEDTQGKANVQGEDEGWEFFFKGVKDGYKLTTAPVGSFQANAFGLHDIIGNVSEWCADWYGATYYETKGEPILSDPTGPAGPKNPEDPKEAMKWKRVARGGSWGSFPWRTTSSSRFALLSLLGQTPNGFRIVQGLDEALKPLKAAETANSKTWAGGAEAPKAGPGTPATVTLVPPAPDGPKTSAPLDGVVIPVRPQGEQEMFVVLTWDKRGDIDLHVTEPDGEKCSARNTLTRTGGSLDNDDRFNKGPETYRPGSQRRPGSYKVELCFFADRDGHGQPIKATVRIYSQFQGEGQKCVGTFEIELLRPDEVRRYPIVTVDLPGVTPHDPGPGVVTIQGGGQNPTK